MHTLNTIKDNPGSRKRPMIVGRGIGSGKGKTSGRGGKGQTARSGTAVRGFEGGQNPIYRRLPKRGFKSHLKVSTYEMDFYAVNQLIEKGLIQAGGIVNRELLVTNGIIKKSVEAIVLLANGELAQKVNFSITKATTKAKGIVEAAGGSVSFE